MEKEAREYEEIYGLVMELFERLYELLGTEAVSRKEYLEILSAGLSELKVGMIPAGADRVVAGDLKRTRLSGIRALFFVGVNEGVVPADTGKGGILTEQERGDIKKERSGAGTHGQGRGLHAAVLPVSDDDEAVGASDPFLSGAFGLWEDPAAFQPHRPDEKTVSGGSRTGGRGA